MRKKTEILSAINAAIQIYIPIFDIFSNIEM